jgi:hypothetical protein
VLLGVDTVISLTTPGHPRVIKLHIDMSASRPLLASTCIESNI